LETLLIPATPRILFIGVSKTPDVEAWRRMAATAVRRSKKIRRLAFAGGEVRSIVEGAVVGGFLVEGCKGRNNRASVERVLISGGDPRAVTEGTIVGESINWARRLINEPSNRKPPRVMAEHAREMAEGAGLSCEVLDEQAIRNLKMGALLGVG